MEIKLEKTVDAHFTDEKIGELVTKYNWEMVPTGDGKFRLRQKDKHYMTTVDFAATTTTERKFCVVYNAGSRTEP